jgi:hypothetical protein
MMAEITMVNKRLGMTALRISIVASHTNRGQNRNSW